MFAGHRLPPVAAVYDRRVERIALNALEASWGQAASPQGTLSHA
jgi:hypothetical protein